MTSKTFGAPGRIGLTAAAMAIALPFLASCGNLTNPPARMGMVEEPETGLRFGSVVERNFVTDPSFFRNRKLKVRIRNTSGDTAFDLFRFRSEIESAYAQTGYALTQGEDFGLLLDVNVMYSGQVQTNLASEFAFLGTAAGGLAGATRRDAIAIGTGALAGATLGTIIGSYVTDDTYIIVSKVTFGIVKGPAAGDGKRITFSRSIPGTPEAEEQREERRTARGLETAHSTGVAVYAGGRNTTQPEIAGQVRERIARIIRNII